MKYTTIIFDLDGTLLNTLADLAAATNYALAEHKLPQRTTDEVRLFVGNGIRKLIERAVPADTPAELQEKVFASFNRYYKQHCADSTRPYDGVPQLLQQLGLEGCENLYPHELSGGMAQRTALGRTLFYNPDVILMDEPFSALDYFTRQGLQQTLLDLYKEQRKTIIFVTHDVEEALLLADRILIMDSGTVKNDVPVLLPKPRQADPCQTPSLESGYFCRQYSGCSKAT